MILEQPKGEIHEKTRQEVIFFASWQGGAILSTELGQYPVILTIHLVNKLYIKFTQAWLKWSADLSV